jgi:sugar O-acyltransferase (sialic acid O-acetyltransferase NeuD family)
MSHAAERILIVGSSGQAKVVVDIVERQAPRVIVGLIDRFRTPGNETCGHPVLGGEEDVPALVSSLGVTSVHVAIGDNFVRGMVVERLRELVPGVPFATVIHPGAIIARDVEISEGTAIMAGAVVGPCCRIEECCLINTAASLDHDSWLAAFSSLGPGVSTGGNVSVGRYSAIGIGATIVHGRRVGEHTVVGAGATVLRDIGDHAVAYGTPARIVRRREAGDAYL